MSRFVSRAFVKRFMGMKGTRGGLDGSGYMGGKSARSEQVGQMVQRSKHEVSGRAEGDRAASSDAQAEGWRKRALQDGQRDSRSKGRRRARTHPEAAAAEIEPPASLAAAPVLAREADAKVGIIAALHPRRHKLVVVGLAAECPAARRDAQMEAAAAAAGRLEGCDGVPAGAGRVEAVRRGVHRARVRRELRGVHHHAAGHRAAARLAAAEERRRAEGVGRSGERVEVG